MRIRTTLALILAFLSGGAATLAPLAARAEGASLTGEIGIRVPAIEGSASASVRSHANVSEDTILLTRAALSASLGENSGTSASTSATSSSPARTHAAVLLRSDANVSAIALSPARVMLRYREPAKLFGFIRVQLPVEVSVTADGKTSVTYPWYSFLYATNETSLSVRTDAAARSDLPAASSTLSAAEQATLLDSLHAILKSEADAQASAR